MARAQKPKRGRPFSEEEPLDAKICGYFTLKEHAELVRIAVAETKKAGRTVTLAELLRIGTRSRWLD